MGNDVGNECCERVGLAFGFDLNGVGAHIAYETADIVTRRGSSDRFSKEDALNYTTDLHVSSLAQGHGKIVRRIER